MVQQAEEEEALTHLGGVGQHVVAADQLIPGGRVAAAPQQNLQRNTEEVKPFTASLIIASFLVLSFCQTHLHPGVNAHVFQEQSLTDGSQTGHAPSCHPPQVAEIHVSGEVGRARGGQDVVELMTFKTLKKD